MKPFLLMAGISLTVLLVMLRPFDDRQYAMADAEATANLAGTDALKKLLSPDALTIDAGIDKILAERKGQIDALLPIVDVANKSKYSPRTRAAAAYLLGQLRAPEAVVTLAKALEDGDPELNPFHFHIDRLDAPFWTALVTIGRPSVPALLDSIQNTDNGDSRFLSLTALYHITLASMKEKVTAEGAA